MSYLRVLTKRIPLDNSYENVITFKDIYNADGELVQEHMTKDAFFKKYDTYFNNLEYYQKVNFRYSDTLTTSCKLIDKTISDSELSGLNYCHVVNDSNPRYPRDMFYFIVGINYLSGNVIELNLELDVYTTYFDYTSLHGSSPIFTKRCHCDRFNNYNGLFGCEEALLPDVIDGSYQGNILKSHNALFTNYKWIVVYFANNTPRSYFTSANYATQGEKITSAMSLTNTPISTLINGYPAPFIIGLIPLETTEITPMQGAFKYNLYYGINANYPNKGSEYGEGSYYTLIAQSSYVLGIQFTNFDFSEYLTASGIPSEPMYFVDALGSSGSLTYNCPVIALYHINTKEVTKYNSNLSLYESVGYGDNFVKTYMQNITKRDKALEPKLYTTPYTRYTYTSASDKEYDFSPMLIGKYSVSTGFKAIFTPNPTTNGEMTFIISEPYNLYQSNYMGATAIANYELPYAPSNYREFLTNQKNSFNTGVAMSLVSNIFGGASSILSASATGNVVGGVTGVAGSMLKGLGTIATAESKMKDLKNQPSKLSGNNFDIYSIVSCTDTTKYVNTWSLIPAELEKVSDFYYLNGYSVEMFRDNNMSGKSVYCDKKSIITRKLFDYLQVDENLIDTMNYNKSGEYPMSQVIREKINNTLNRGVRLWFITNVDEYKNFTLENKEIN